MEELREEVESFNPEALKKFSFQFFGSREIARELKRVLWRAIKGGLELPPFRVDAYAGEIWLILYDEVDEEKLSQILSSVKFEEKPQPKLEPEPKPKPKPEVKKTKKEVRGERRTGGIKKRPRKIRFTLELS